MSRDELVASMLAGVRQAELCALRAREAIEAGEVPLTLLREMRGVAADALDRSVLLRKMDGATWTDIAIDLDVTKQAAQQRYRWMRADAQATWVEPPAD